MDEPTTDKDLIKSRSNLISQATLFIDVMNFGASKGTNMVVTYAENYKAVLGKQNMKVDKVHLVHEKLFEQHREDILNSDKNMFWAKDKTVTVHFGGDDRRYAKKNYILKLSIAFFKAYNVREEIEKRIKAESVDGKEPNPNFVEMERGRFEYSFTEELLFRMLVVIRDALGETHPDFKKVSKLCEHFRAMTRHRDREEVPQNPDGIAAKLSKVSGGGITSDKISQAIGGLVGQDGLFEGIEDMYTQVKNAPKTGDKKKDMANILTNIGPQMADALTSVTDILNDNAEDSGSSSD